MAPPSFRLLLALPLLLAPADALARVRCLTPQFLASRGADSPSMASPNPYRPEAVGYVDSAIYPLRIHYRREVDADRAGGVVLNAAETSWEVEIDTWGWPEPPVDEGLGGDDRYDIYLTNEDTFGGAYTWGTGQDVTADDGWYSLSSFIALDDQWIGDADMLDFVAHEFNHALQYTIDGWESTLFVWEMVATAVEDVVVDETNLYALDIPDFQELPFASLLFDGYTDEVIEYNDYSYYEYGGVLFGLFLEQRYGTNDSTTLLSLWEGMAAGERAAEPDFLDSLDALPQAGGADLQDLYLEFALWRLFAASWDDENHFEEGAEWIEPCKVELEGVVDLTDLGSPLHPVDAPYDLGVSYFALSSGGDLNGTVTATVEGDGEGIFGVVGAVWQEEGSAVTASVRGADSSPPSPLVLDLNGGTRAVIGVANLGTSGMDAETLPPRRDFSLSLAWKGESGDDDTPDDDATADDDATSDDDDDATSDDDDASGDDDGPGNTACDGCNSGGTPPPSLVALGLLLAALLRRPPSSR